jgi:hypothetical protein
MHQSRPTTRNVVCVVLAGKATIFELEISSLFSRIGVSNPAGEYTRIGFLERASDKHKWTSVSIDLRWGSFTNISSLLSISAWNCHGGKSDERAQVGHRRRETSQNGEKNRGIILTQNSGLWRLSLTYSEGLIRQLVDGIIRVHLPTRRKTGFHRRHL